MAGQGRELGGLVLCLLGVLGVCIACGMPMWREMSFVGANIVTAQTVWDGLWLHCVVQATGQMQCKKHVSPISMTTDLQAGRALTIISILVGLLGALIALLGGGVTNCGRTPPERFAQQLPSAKNKVAVLGGALCVLSGLLCLIAASWSAANTISFSRDPLVVAALKREVGSSIYVGSVSSLLLLLGGALLCCVCARKRNFYDSYPAYTPYSAYSSQRSHMPPNANGAGPGPHSEKHSHARQDSRERPYDGDTSARVVDRIETVYDQKPSYRAQSVSRAYDQAQGGKTETLSGSMYHDPPSTTARFDPSMTSYTGAQRPGVFEYNLPSRANTDAGVYYHNPASVVSTGHLPGPRSF